MFRFFSLYCKCSCYVFFLACDIPDFKNLHYPLHLNESKDDVSAEKDLKNDSSVEIRDINTSSIDNNLNVKDIAPNMLDNRLRVTFVSKNVLDLFKRNHTDSEIFLLSKGLNFVPTSNTIDKPKLKTELEVLGRIVRCKCHFRNKENEFDLDQFKP